MVMKGKGVFKSWKEQPSIRLLLSGTTDWKDLTKFLEITDHAQSKLLPLE